MSSFIEYGSSGVYTVTPTPSGDAGQKLNGNFTALVDKDAALQALIDSANAAIAALNTAVAAKLAKASNLSDLASATAARSNLGLDTAATHPATDFANATHTHAESDITGLTSDLAGKVSTGAFNAFSSSVTSGLAGKMSLAPGLTNAINTLSSTGDSQNSGVTLSQLATLSGATFTGTVTGATFQVPWLASTDLFAMPFGNGSAFKFGIAADAGSRRIQLYAKGTDGTMGVDIQTGATPDTKLSVEDNGDVTVTTGNLTVSGGNMFIYAGSFTAGGGNLSIDGSGNMVTNAGCTLGTGITFSSTGNTLADFGSGPQFSNGWTGDVNGGSFTIHVSGGIITGVSS